MSFDLYLDAIIRGLMVGSVYGMVAIAFIIVYSATKIMNFAQGDLLTLGLFTGYTVFHMWHLHPMLALLASMALPAVAGFFEYWVAVKPTEKTSSLFAPFVTTFAFGLIIREVIRRVWGSTALVFPNYIDLGMVNIFGVRFPGQSGLVFVVGVLVVVIYTLFIGRTKLGSMLRATFINKELASLRGVNVVGVAAGTWALGGAMSGLAGFLGGPILSAYYGVGVNTLLIAFIAATIGGYTSVIGTFLGGLIIGVVSSVAGLALGGTWHAAVLFVVLALLLLLSPQGLFGRRLARKV